MSWGDSVKGRLALLYSVGFVLVGVLLFTGLAIAAVTVTRTDFTTNSFNFNEDVSLAYNITVNNSVASLANGQVHNLTQVNITIPSSFVLLANATNSTFGDVSSATLSVSGSVLSWTNATFFINASIVGTNQTFGFNASALTPGIYNITVVATNFSNTYNSNLTVRVNDTTRPIVFKQNITRGGHTTMVDFSNYSGTIVLNVSVLDNSIINAVFFNVTNSTGTQVFIVNITNPAGNAWNGSFNTALLGDGLYNFTVFANDTFGNLSNRNSSERVSIYIDNTAPSPSMSCTPNPAESGDTVTCTCSGTDSLSGVNATTTTTPSTSSTGSYTQTCSVVDRAGNVATTSASLVINPIPGAGSSSGGGSGGSAVSWTKTVPQTLSELSASVPVEQNLGSRERVALKVGGQTHHVGVVSLTSSSAIVEVSSEPQRLTLNVGEEKMSDVDSNGFYDLAVKLVSIVSGKANVEIRAVNVRVEEPVAGEDVSEGVSEEPQGIAETISSVTSSSKTWIWIALIVVIAVAVAIVVMRRKR